MARLNVNPTRMEMTRLKKQLKTATRGHKMLKDKLDELMKQFLEIVKENKKLRQEAEKSLEAAYKSFIIARAVMSEEYMGEALMMPKQKVVVDVAKKNIMSVNVPVFDFKAADSRSDIYPYGFAFTSGELDTAMESFQPQWNRFFALQKAKKQHSFLHRKLKKQEEELMLLKT